jgi:hypothetical protein
MTEKEWWACIDPAQMLGLLGLASGASPQEPRPAGGASPAAPTSTASDRELRLFACACCRDGRLFGWLGEAGNSRALLVAEAFADGAADAGQLEASRAEAVHSGVVWACRAEARSAAESWADCKGLTRPRRAARAEVLREVFGPRSPVLLDPGVLAWQAGLAVRLAEGLYEERAFERLPILADALEEAGCADDRVLSHLRGPGRHARGCWALDAVLGRR